MTVSSDQDAAPYRRIVDGLALFLFSAILLAPNVFGWIYIFEDAGNYNYPWQRLSYAIALWVCVLAAIGNVRRACLLVMPFMLLVPLQCYLLIRYQAPLLPHAIGLLLESNTAEVAEYMQGLWWVAFFSYGTMFLVAYACLRVLNRGDFLWRHRSRYWILAGVLASGCGFYSQYEDQEKGFGLQSRPDEFRSPPLPFLIERLRETSPFGIPLNLYAYLESERTLALAQARLKDWRFGAHQLPTATVPQAIVLVFGESGRADRWRLNGYKRATSPRLEAMPNLVSLRDMATVATTTRQSIPAMLTRRSARELTFNTAFAERSLISAFGEAGFRTYWFSTQMPAGHLDSPISVYAREADVLKFLNFSSYSYRTPYDAVLLPELERALREDVDRQLFVFHTLGSHFNYGFRYPPEFELFRPAMGDAVAGSLHDSRTREPLNNAYDNSILYTDHVLAEIIRILKSSGRSVAAMLYVADHGENLFDEDCSLAGHGVLTRQNIQVASFFWYSPGFADAYPQKIANLRKNQDKKLSSGGVFDAMLDLVDIRFPGENVSRSLFSSRFKEHPRLVAGINTVLDYDLVNEHAGCQLDN